MEVRFDAIRYLKEHDIPMGKAAEAAGVAQQNICSMLKGNPTIGKLVLMCNNLGIDIRELFYPAEETQSAPSDESDLLSTENDEPSVPQTQNVSTTAFCPHCGGKVKVGVVLMGE